MQLLPSQLDCLTLVSELEGRAEEQRGSRMVLLWLLLSYNHLTSLPACRGSETQLLHLQLQDLSMKALMALGSNLLWQNSLSFLMDRNKRIGKTGLLLQGLAHSPFSGTLQELNITESSSPCSSASHSSTSHSESASEDEASDAAPRMQNVLLG